MAKAIKSKLIPVISWVQAGSWHESLNCNHEGEVITSPYRCSDEAFALEVRGDSMTAQTGSKFSFPEGSRIIVEPNAEARHRSFVVARIHGTDEATFKRLNIEGDHYLQPLNPQYPIMPVNSNIHICGVVVGMIQKIPF
ncbi:repressor protein C2 [Shewanella baltica]|nr:repressor protein C2 [Shewanella baltica]MCS6272599.1 repressor protein C2 [Shewanella baltica]